MQNIKEYYGASLRTEEMVNYFDYDYILPNEYDLFGVKTVISECPWNADHYLLTIGLATEDEAPEVKGNNLVFLIDVSGSMYSDDKLPLLKRTFSRLAENMTENDRISIVTYSGREDVLLEACPGNQYDTIMNAINRLQAQGSTNGQAGLTKAYDIATSCYIEGGNNRIIMASDGDLNVGISTAEELTDYISEKRESGIYLSVLGFGDGNYRDANMEALADNGNGVYYYIDSDGEAEKVFGKKLTSTLYTVANDVKIQITFDANKVEEYRLVGYENRILDKEDFENDTKDAGELGSGHTVTVCYELVLKDGALASDANIAKFAARWKKPGASVSNLQECNIKTSAYTKTPDPDFIFISAVIQTSMILRSSQFISKDADIADIIGTLKSLELADKDKLQFIDLLEKMK